MRERHERYDGTPFARRHFEPSKRVVGQHQPRLAEDEGFACRKQWVGQPRKGTDRTVRTASTQRCARGTSTKSTQQGPEHRTVPVRQGLLLTDLFYNSARRRYSSSSWQGRKVGRHMRERETHENDTEVRLYARYPRAAKIVVRSIKVVAWDL